MEEEGMEKKFARPRRQSRARAEPRTQSRKKRKHDLALIAAVSVAVGYVYSRLSSIDFEKHFSEE